MGVKLTPTNVTKTYTIVYGMQNNVCSNVRSVRVVCSTVRKV